MRMNKQNICSVSHSFIENITMYRTEHDALGDMQVPSRALYGIYTQRVLNNFPDSGNKVPLAFIKTYIKVKKAYANANHKAKKLKKPFRDAIVKACTMLLELDEKKLYKHFPIDRIQSGG